MVVITATFNLFGNYFYNYLKMESFLELLNTYFVIPNYNTDIITRKRINELLAQKDKVSQDDLINLMRNFSWRGEDPAVILTSQIMKFIGSLPKEEILVIGGQQITPYLEQNYRVTAITDISKLKLKSKSVRFVILNSILSKLDLFQRNELLAQLREAITPDGYLLVKDYDGFQYLSRLFIALITEQANMPPVKFLTSKEINDLLIDHYFSSSKFRCWLEVVI